MDKSRYLIIGNNEATWKFDRPILFLGDWCLLYERKYIWNKLDSLVAEPYGMSKSSKDKDHIKSNEIFNNIFPILRNSLNKYHQVNHDDRYWNILLGHWLTRYINVMINRIGTIEQCIEKYKISGVALFTDDQYLLATNDTISSLWAFNDDQWNNVLYKSIFGYFNHNIPIDFIERNDSKRFIFKGLNYNIPFYKKFNLYIKETISKFLKIFLKDNHIFILHSYIGQLNEIKLQMSLKQMPQLWLSKDIKLNSKPDLKLREDLKETTKFSPVDYKEKIIFEMLFDVIPICFLEGYQDLNEIVKKLDWPNNPKLIFTSNSFDTDEVFKFWTASKINQGTKYIVGQHGGNYGTHCYANPTVEEKTSDIFLTWGWSDGLEQHTPAFVLNNLKYNDGQYNQNGGLLFVQDMVYHRIDTWDRISEHRNYYKNQLSFYDALSNNPQSDLILRLHSSYRHTNPFEAKMWLEHNPNINIDYGDNKLNKRITQSRLSVFSYDSTGILELLSKNIPVMAFWDNNLDHIRDSAMPFYNELIEAEIIHLSPRSAAKKINEVWDDIESWWNNDVVQHARISFCEKYAVQSKNKITDLKRIFEETL